MPMTPIFDELAAAAGLSIPEPTTERPAATLEWRLPIFPFEIPTARADPDPDRMPPEHGEHAHGWPA